MSRRPNPHVILLSRDVNYNRYTKHPFPSPLNPRGDCEILAELNNPMGQTFQRAIFNRYASTTPTNTSSPSHA